MTGHELQSLTAVEVVARLESRYFPQGRFSPEQAIQYIRDEANTLGIQLQSKHEGDWWILWATRDWLPRGDKARRAFWELLHFPEAGVDAHRCEVFLTTFAEVVLTASRGNVTVIKDSSGQASEAETQFSDELARFPRVIVFA